MIKVITQDESFLQEVSIDVDLRAEEDIILTKEIIQDLKDTALDVHFNNEIGCGGLASNQIKMSKRIFIIKDKKNHFKTFINPRIIKKSKKMIHIEGGEGCLSRPGKFTIKRRHNKIEVAYNDIEGKKKKATYSGMQSIAFQHEVDHLNGILI